MAERQYRGLGKYNYYRLKQDTWSREPGVYLEAGTKILYWAEASHSTQHTQSRYYFVTTNPEGGPMVSRKIWVPPTVMTFLVLDGFIGLYRRVVCFQKPIRTGVERELKVVARIVMQKGKTVRPNEARAVVSRRLHG